MKKNKSLKWSKITSGILATIMAVSLIPSSLITSAETESYPYTMFSSGSININNTSSMVVNGDICTSGTFTATSQNKNINGKLTENSEETMIYLNNKLCSTYFSSNDTIVYAEDYTLNEVNININQPLSVEGEIDMTGNVNLNSGMMALQDISLNGEVKNTNNAVVYSKYGNIVIDSQNVNLNGLIYAPYGNIEITAQNLNMNCIIIANDITIDSPSINLNYNSSMAAAIGNTSEEVVDEDYELYALGEYDNESNSINIEWNTNATDGSYEVFSSDDNETYESEGIIESGNTYQYNIGESFEIKYFKVALNINNKVIESIPFSITKTEDGYVCNYVDSDGDGLYDVLEERYGTDINKADSDDDGLTDYQEIFITNTNPIVYNSFNESLSDAEADSDEDGISNVNEISLGTDPLQSDTDSDGLCDYDEINTYGTDPLLADTDQDTLLDGDELKIGLDPKNPETFDMPDAEYKVPQTISSDSSTLSQINTEDNPYKLSIDIIAAGYVEGNITADESSYAKTMQCDSMIGVAPELTYENADSIESVKLKFEISADYINNSSLSSFSDDATLSGIKHLNIFKYFEDLNMLLPIETQFDEENNIIYANVDELGTYCVMDMDSWLSNFESEQISDDLESEQIQLYSSNSSDALTIEEDNSDEADCLDIIFTIYTGKLTDDELTTVKNNIYEASNIVFSEFQNTRIYIYSINDKAITLSNGKDYADNMLDILEMLNSLQLNPNTSRTIENITQQFINKLNLRKESNKYWFYFTYTGKGNIGFTPGSSSEPTTQTAIANKINCSVIDDDLDAILPNSFTNSITSSTGGKIIELNENSYIAMVQHLYDTGAINDNTEFNAIVPTGWKNIKLDGNLSPNNNIDTDEDSLIDWEEVDIDKITLNDDCTITLPTIQECINYTDKSYAEEGLTRFKSEQWVSGIDSTAFDRYLNYILNNTYILPIHSDPTKADSDGDGLDDNLDNGKLDASIHSFLIYETKDTNEYLESCTENDEGPDDFRYADITKEDLRSMKKINFTDFLPESVMIAGWRVLVSDFTSGNMKKVGQEMVDYFISGNGGTYSNDILTNEARNHKDSNRYISETTNIINNWIESHNGDIANLIYNSSNRDSSIMVSEMSGNVDPPAYEDVFGGLGMCVDGTYANQFEITSYKFNGVDYEYNIKYTIYDIYGLEGSDISDPDRLFQFGTFQGFRFWYILQHYDKYNGKYKPFITTIEFEETIKGVVK